MKFILEVPILKNISPKLLTEALDKKNKDSVLAFVKSISNKKYLCWDKAKYYEPAPQHIKREVLWLITKFIREGNSLNSPVRDEKGRYFTWSKLDYFEEFFHDLDMSTGGELSTGISITKAHKQRLITRGLMEEAIASSQLEGADTTRQVAKKMLREGRKPRNKSEQMIVNNYRTMKCIEDDYKDREMSLNLILELHGSLTRNTMDSEGEQPRLRKAGEKIYVADKITGLKYHEGPDIKFVTEELERLIEFANNSSSSSFIHPVIKAIILHFWVGYLHPFTDGNGRIARQIFYWYLLKNGYWAFVYLPISKTIKSSSKQYYMSYVYSEQDDNDLSYFINYNLHKIATAKKEFKTYIEDRFLESARMLKVPMEDLSLNERQIHLLKYLHSDADLSTTFSAHMNMFGISTRTASKDLKDLVQQGLLREVKYGKKVSYYGTEKILSLFA